MAAGTAGPGADRARFPGRASASSGQSWAAPADHPPRPTEHTRFQDEKQVRGPGCLSPHLSPEQEGHHAWGTRLCPRGKGRMRSDRQRGAHGLGRAREDGGVAFSSEGAACQPPPGHSGWGRCTRPAEMYLFISRADLEGHPAVARRVSGQHPGERVRVGEGAEPSGRQNLKDIPGDQEMPLLLFLPHLQTPSLTGASPQGSLCAHCQGRPGGRGCWWPLDPGQLRGGGSWEPPGAGLEAEQPRARP